MQQTYQYSSLFTAGLLAPRPSIPVSWHTATPTTQDGSSSIQLPPNSSGFKSAPEPILVTISTNVPTPRRATHRRRSSATLQLSPVVAHRTPFRDVKEARERAMRHSATSPVLSGKASYMAVYQPMNGLLESDHVNNVSRNQDHKKLLYGPFSRLLAKGRASLERHLEKFFTVWAWKWEVDQPPTFISHIGTPLSPYNKYLTPLLEDVKILLPESTPVILLSSVDVLAASPLPSSQLWNTLPSHLIRHVPPYDPPPPPPPSSSSDAPLDSTNKALVKKPSKRQSGLVSPGNMDTLVRTQGMGANATATLMASMPNMKKLAGYFTFSGRSSPALGVPTAQSVFTPPQTTESTGGNASVAPSVDLAETGADRPGSSSKADNKEAQSLPMPTPSNPVVDQQALEEAIGSVQNSLPSTSADPVPTDTVATKRGDTPVSGETTSSTSSHIPFVSPTLGYLNNAAEGLMSAFTHPVSMFQATGNTESAAASTENDDAKKSPENDSGDATGNEDVDYGENTKGHNVHKPIVEIIDVDADAGAQGEEIQTDRSDSSSSGERGRNLSTPAQRSLHRVLSRSLSHARPADLTHSSADGSKETNPGNGGEGNDAQNGQQEHPAGADQDKSSIRESGSSQLSETESNPDSKKNPSSPPEAFFVPLTVYLEDKDTKELTLRRVYHISVEGLMLALVLNSSPSRASILSPDTPVTTQSLNTLSIPSYLSSLVSPSSGRVASMGGIDVIEGLGYPAYVDLPRGVEYPIIEILKKARGVLNKWQTEVEKNLLRHGTGKSTTSTTGSSAPFYGLFGGGSSSSSSSQTSSVHSSISTLTSQMQGMRNFAVANGNERNGEDGIVLASLGFTSSSGWLFEGRMALERDETIVEQFSRTTTSQSWYISKRIPASSTKQQSQTPEGKKGGDGGEENGKRRRREVHMEIGRKEASLVDVDNDLVSMLRKLEAMKD
ncbi:hypothetical protein FRC17_010488 [Serendipita sp. 399]|nr:hypothetical protein FRC17_010488 [Serendipita sp. 399]